MIYLFFTIQMSKNKSIVEEVIYFLEYI